MKHKVKPILLPLRDLVEKPPVGLASLVMSRATVHLYADAMKATMGFAKEVVTSEVIAKRLEQDNNPYIPMYEQHGMPPGIVVACNEAGKALAIYSVLITGYEKEKKQ